jgi:peptide/nickel transport system substrate-binding protein
MLGYDPSFQGYPFDLTQATRLIAKGGKASVRIDTVQEDKTLAEAVAGQLQKAGLKATVNVLETQAFTEGIEKGTSQAYVWSWGVSEGDADVLFASQFWSTTRKDTVYTGYRSAQVDKLIEQGRSSTDKAERAEIYHQAIETVMHDAPWAPLVTPQEIYGVSTKVKNWQPSPIGRFNVAQTSLS